MWRVWYGKFVGILACRHFYCRAMRCLQRGTGCIVGRIEFRQLAGLLSAASASHCNGLRFHAGSGQPSEHLPSADRSPVPISAALLPTRPTVRRVIRQEPSVQRSSWVIAAAARMAGGAAGSMISSMDRTVAWSPDGPDSTMELRVRCSVPGPSAAQIGPTPARSASRPTAPGPAAVSGLSRAAFARSFQRALGQARMRYVTSWRMTLARDYLRLGQPTLAQLAERTGYTSPYAFAAASPPPRPTPRPVAPAATTAVRTARRRRRNGRPRRPLRLSTMEKRSRPQGPEWTTLQHLGLTTCFRPGAYFTMPLSWYFASQTCP
jgi:AraC-like DNA-binding protein